MGQYHIPVNLDKREFIHPHKLGNGLKLMEQVLSNPGTSAALMLLLGVSVKGGARGGGDPRSEHPLLGAWGGDRIVVIGDYAERGDIAPEDNADVLYSACAEDEEEFDYAIAHYRKLADEADVKGGSLYGSSANEWRDRADRLKMIGRFTDISDQVVELLEAEFRGTRDDGGETTIMLNPDMVIGVEGL